MNDAAKTLSNMMGSDRVLQVMQKAEPTWWWQRAATDVPNVIEQSGIPKQRIAEAALRFKRFAPWFMKNYPESKVTGGILESPLHHETNLVDALSELSGHRLRGHLWFKRDDLLPVSGSVKARGGIHEVLEIAERIAFDSGLLRETDNYTKFDSPELRNVFSEHGIAVGSTGNLGLSIGLVAAKLGFNTTVHMSSDAREWKKETLRAQGVRVVAHPGDFSEAVEAGRAEALEQKNVHFVDDENSLSLFSGYAVAAERLRGQLESLAVSVDKDHPLFVYIPCGVGGAPGGLTYGLKSVFGSNVHIVLIEPTESPAMTLGVRTGLHDEVSAADLGLSGLTAADGLAVGRPSALVGKAVGPLFDGFATLTDAQIMASLGHLSMRENVAVEPSAAAVLPIPWIVEQNADFLENIGVSEAKLANSTHIVWFTGGSMVPKEEMQGYLTDAFEAATQVGPALFNLLQQPF